MTPIPSESTLKNYLRRVEEIDDLPTWAEIEPGSFLYVVKEIWEREQDRDGRRGHLSENKIASLIGKISKRKFTRNQYQSMFGAGRKDQKSKQDVPVEVAKAFLLVAFTHWSFGHIDSGDDKPPNTQSILPDLSTDYKEIVGKIIKLMYSTGIPIKCLPVPGLGPKGFYRNCRKRNRSVIIATEREHIVMNNPGSGLKEWSETVRILFKYQDQPEYDMMHIWAVKEPFISDDPRSIGNLYHIGLLQTAFRVARALCLSKDEFPTWEELSKKCIIVMLLNKTNDKYRSEPPPSSDSQDELISDYFIFPNEVPWLWRSRDDENLSLNDINFITTIDDGPQEEIQVRYNIFLHKENSKTPPVIQKNSPSNDSDESFRNLYLACKQYSEKTDCEELQKIHENAVNHRWKFMTAQEFINLDVP
ncbi:MAG: hypothetical protein ACRBBN_15775 [Methyloligellaceae bacterium]